MPEEPLKPTAPSKLIIHSEYTPEPTPPSITAATNAPVLGSYVLTLAVI